MVESEVKKRNGYVRGNKTNKKYLQNIMIVGSLSTLNLLSVYTYFP